MHGPEVTRCAPAARVLALVALTWTLVGCPAGTASADACAYASTGPDGMVAVAYAGDHWPPPPLCPTPTPPPPTPTPSPPPPPPPPKPKPKPTPRPAPKPTPRPRPPARPAPAPPAPRPTPPPALPPTPKPKPAPQPSVTPVRYPAYHPHRTAHVAPGHTTPVTYVLLITVPAIVAVAALRPR
ncbi:hypothetical protein [Streptomyces sp. NPDC002078]